MPGRSGTPLSLESEGGRSTAYLYDEPMTSRLESISVSGYRSIESLTLSFDRNLTLLIGANGSGKSNLVGAFELLGRVLDNSVRDSMLQRGGFSSHLHRSPTGPDASEIHLGIWSEPRPSILHDNNLFRNGYEVTLSGDSEDLPIVSEVLYIHNISEHKAPFDVRLGLSKESRLRDLASNSKHARAMKYILELAAGCRVYHFDDTSPDSPALTRSSVSDNIALHSDASNIAALLLEMRERKPHSYRRIVRAVQTVAPFFDDFVLVPQSDSIILRWRERGLDSVFSGQALSSGTLRFICLATLLFQPSPPATIVLDEPELGLHPFAIHQLAELFRNASEKRQIIAATQSVTLLSQFSIHEVAVVDQLDGSTTVDRPDEALLGQWLNDYSLGELWEMNLLGGRPRSAARGAETIS